MRDNRMYLLEAEFNKRFRAILTDVSDPWHIAFTIGGFISCSAIGLKRDMRKRRRKLRNM